MALVSLVAKIRVEGAEAAARALHSVRDAAHTAATALGSRLGSAVSSVASGFATTASRATLLGGALSGVAGVAAFQTAATMDSLTRGLASVSTGAEDLQGQLSRLREVAKLPGLGFEEAVRGSVSLQAAGLSANIAERSLAAFGNALATVGRGKADLDGVTLALQQIAAKGKVSAEEINQINERVPQIRAAMNAAFGTSNTEALGKMGIDAQRFISGVVTELEKLPKVSGGIQNTLENLQDGIKQAILPLGQGIAALFMSTSGAVDSLLGKFTKLSTSLGEVFAAIGKSGVLSEALSKLFGGAFETDGLQNGLIKIASNVVAFVGNISEGIAVMRHNIAEGIGFGLSLIENFAAKITATASLIGEGLSMMGKSIADAMRLAAVGFSVFSPQLATMAQLLVGVATQLGNVGKAFVNSQMQLFSSGMAAVDIMHPIKTPDFREFNPLQGAEGIEARIRANLGRLQGPDNLTFGGGGLQSGVSKQLENVFASWDSNLANIERNTKKSADILDSRRTFGGGDLSRMGITPEERFSMAQPDPYTRSLDSTLRSAIHRTIRQAQQGTGRRAAALYGRV